MPRRVQWDALLRSDREAVRELGALAALIASREGREPTWSGDGEITVRHRQGGETVYVRRYRVAPKERPHARWRIGNNRMRKTGFVYCETLNEVLDWMEAHGYLRPG